MGNITWVHVYRAHPKYEDETGLRVERSRGHDVVEIFHRSFPILAQRQEISAYVGSKWVTRVFDPPTIVDPALGASKREPRRLCETLPIVVPKPGGVGYQVLFAALPRDDEYQYTVFVVNAPDRDYLGGFAFEADPDAQLHIFRVFSFSSVNKEHGPREGVERGSGIYLVTYPKTMGRDEVVEKGRFTKLTFKKPPPKKP
jgi:hypothetical protein